MLQDFWPGGGAGCPENKKEAIRPTRKPFDICWGIPGLEVELDVQGGRTITTTEDHRQWFCLATACWVPSQEGKEVYMDSRGSRPGF